MVHQPIAIDCADADGKAEGAGSAEPGLSTDQGSVGASVERVAFPSAPPRPSPRDKEAVRYRVEKERWLSKQPKRVYLVLVKAKFGCSKVSTDFLVRHKPDLPVKRKSYYFEGSEDSAVNAKSDFFKRSTDIPVKSKSSQLVGWQDPRVYSSKPNSVVLKYRQILPVRYKPR